MAAMGVAMSKALTRKAFRAAVYKIMEQRPEPSYYVMHPATLAAGKRAGDYNAGAAWEMFNQADALPRWTWRRRSRFTLRGIDLADNAEALWNTFG